MAESFAHALAECLKFDQYLKVVDISQNRFSLECMKELVQGALAENSSLLCFDARMNPGCTEKIKK